MRSAFPSVVSIRIGRAELLASAFTAASISSPFMLGMLTSQMTIAMSRWAVIVLRPWAPSSASSTSYPACSSAVPTSCRIARESSTTRTFADMGPPLDDTQRPSKQHQIALGRARYRLGGRFEQLAAGRRLDLEADRDDLASDGQRDLDDPVAHRRATADVAAAQRGRRAGLEVQSALAEAALDAAQGLVGQLARPVEQLGQRARPPVRRRRERAGEHLGRAGDDQAAAHRARKAD